MAAQGRGFWTDDRVALLRQLWLADVLLRDIAARLGNTPDACSSKAAAIKLPKRARGKPRASARHRVHHDHKNIGTPIAELNKAMKPETAAQSEIWAGVKFTDHPAAARPEGKLRGLPDSARSMIGCAAALTAGN